jgi:hypothetical protein
VAGAAHQRLEERKLLGREFDLVVLPPDLTRTGIDAQGSDLERRRLLDLAAARERAEAGEELCERERLRQVVVGAGVETLDPVLDRVAGSQHEHR